MVNRHQTAHNHTLAPIAGKFVQDWRDSFPNAKVTYMQEGAMELGKRDDAPAFEARPYRSVKR